MEDDTSDEEYNTTKDKVRGCNSKLYDLAQQLQKEAVEGRLGVRKKAPLLDQSKRHRHLLGPSVLVNMKRVM